MSLGTEPLMLGTAIGRLEAIYTLFVDDRYRIRPVAGSGLLVWEPLYPEDERAVCAAADMTAAMQAAYGLPPVRQTVAETPAAAEPLAGTVVRIPEPRKRALMLWLAVLGGTLLWGGVLAGLWGGVTVVEALARSPHP